MYNFFWHFLYFFSISPFFWTFFSICWCFLFDFLHVFSIFSVFLSFFYDFFIFFCIFCPFFFQESSIFQVYTENSSPVSFFWSTFSSRFVEVRSVGAGALYRRRSWEPNTKPTWKSWSKKGNGTFRGKNAFFGCIIKPKKDVLYQKLHIPYRCFFFIKNVCFLS